METTKGPSITIKKDGIETYWGITNYIHQTLALKDVNIDTNRVTIDESIIIKHEYSLKEAFRKVSKNLYEFTAYIGYEPLTFCILSECVTGQISTINGKELCTINDSVFDRLNKDTIITVFTLNGENHVRDMLIQFYKNRQDDKDSLVILSKISSALNIPIFSVSELFVKRCSDDIKPDNEISITVENKNDTDDYDIIFFFGSRFIKINILTLHILSSEMLNEVIATTDVTTHSFVNHLKPLGKITIFGGIQTETGCIKQTYSLTNTETKTKDLVSIPLCMNRVSSENSLYPVVEMKNRKTILNISEVIYGEPGFWFPGDYKISDNVELLSTVFNFHRLISSIALYELCDYSISKGDKFNDEVFNVQTKLKKTINEILESNRITTNIMEKKMFDFTGVYHLKD